MASLTSGREPASSPPDAGASAALDTDLDLHVPVRRVLAAADEDHEILLGGDGGVELDLFLVLLAAQRLVGHLSDPDGSCGGQPILLKDQKRVDRAVRSDLDRDLLLPLRRGGTELKGVL